MKKRNNIYPMICKKNQCKQTSMLHVIKSRGNDRVSSLTYTEIHSQSSCESNRNCVHDSFIPPHSQSVSLTSTQPKQKHVNIVIIIFFCLISFHFFFTYHMHESFSLASRHHAAVDTICAKGEVSTKIS